MTRIAGAADLHIGARHLTDLHDQERALEHVVDELVDRGVDLLLVAGDVFDTNRPSPPAIAAAARFFGRLEREGIDAVVSKGNHDPDAAEIIAWLKGRACVPATPTVLRDIAGVDVAVMPWLVDQHVRAGAGGAATREETARQLTFAAQSILAGCRVQRRPGVPLVLVTHATIAGSETATGWNMGYRPETHWIVPVEDLEGFDLVVAGHIHKRQFPTPRIAVPGSLLPLDFSETEDKGIVVADLHESVVPEWEFARIPTPQLATIVIDSRESLQAFVDIPLADPAQLVRVRVHVDEATAREYPPARIESALRAAGARKVQVELEVERPDRARDEQMTSELLPLTALGRYVDGRDDLEPAARARVIAAGTVAIGEVLEDPRTAPLGDLRLTLLEVEDFLGVSRATLDLADVDVAALVAPVGRGKSTLSCDAIRWALFGISRQGARSTERVVRQGQREASVALELTAGDGRQYRIVRKVKVSPGGRAAQTLDVLTSRIEKRPGIRVEHPWEPVSSGKLADGEGEISRILGGLTDRTLVAANLVVQRSSNTFAAARPEERKELLAEAAGLELYGDLALRTAKHLNETERELGALEAKAEPLRARAEAVERIEGEHQAAAAAAAAATSDVRRLEQASTDARVDVEKAQDRADAWQKLYDDAKRIQGEVETLDGERAALERKADVARSLLAQRLELEAARSELADLRTEIQQIQDETSRQQAARADRERERSAAIAKRAEISTRLMKARADREREVAGMVAELRALNIRVDQLEASECLMRCAHVASCTVTTDHAATRARIAELSQERDRSELVPQSEMDLEAELAALTIPEPLPLVERTVVLDAKRRKERDLEDAVKVADKIAAAEAVLAEHDQAIAKVDEELAGKKRALGQANGLLMGFAGDPRAELERVERKERALLDELRSARGTAMEEANRTAMLAGRLEELRAAAAELVEVEGRMSEAAAAAAAWKELVVAWRACRVMTLETSVIPAVEDTANEVLRRFPYGLQLRLVTQREKKSGDGLAETLDIEILGGKAPVYELLSGGQATAVDVSLHLAIALVVSRRQRTRLQWLTLDEPEGLDADGRAAFAAIARWCHETFGLAVLVSSHHEDLVDQLGAQVIRIEGEAGNAHVGDVVTEDEREAVSA